MHRGLTPGSVRTRLLSVGRIAQWMTHIGSAGATAVPGRVGLSSNPCVLRTARGRLSRGRDSVAG